MTPKTRAALDHAIHVLCGVNGMAVVDGISVPDAHVFDTRNDIAIIDAAIRDDPVESPCTDTLRS